MILFTYFPDPIARILSPLSYCFRPQINGFGGLPFYVEVSRIVTRAVIKIKIPLIVNSQTKILSCMRIIIGGVRWSPSRFFVHKPPPVFNCN